jgi:excisionase family DNA binding protein
MEVEKHIAIQEQIAQLSRQLAALSEQISDLHKAFTPKSDPALQKTLLARKEAASALSISLSAVDQLIVRGELKVRRIGKRLLVPRKELECLAARDIPVLWPAG